MENKIKWINHATWRVGGSQKCVFVTRKIACGSRIRVSCVIYEMCSSFLCIHGQKFNLFFRAQNFPVIKNASFCDRGVWIYVCDKCVWQLFVTNVHQKEENVGFWYAVLICECAYKFGVFCLQVQYSRCIHDMYVWCCVLL